MDYNELSGCFPKAYGGHGTCLEMDKVDMRTKILCRVAAFTALGRGEVEFFFKMAHVHKIPKEEVEVNPLLTGLESAFQMLKWQLRFLRGYTPDMLTCHIKTREVM